MSEGVGAKIRDWAALLTAAGGILLGVLAYVRDTRDPKAEASHEDASKVIGQLSSDLRRAARAIRRNRRAVESMRVLVLGYAMGAGTGKLSPEQLRKLLEQIDKQKSIGGWDMPPQRHLRRWRELRRLKNEKQQK